MSPRALLFSSDEGTSLRIGQTLRELELEVLACPEIFAAVEKLTLGNIEIVIADWDMGPEAAFLLKSSREVQSTRDAFRIAIGRANEAAAREAGAHLILHKPLAPETVKSALMTSNDFLSRMQRWVRQTETVPVQTVKPAIPKRIEEPVVEETLPTAVEPRHATGKKDSDARIESLFEKELRAEAKVLPTDQPAALPQQNAVNHRAAKIVRRTALGLTLLSSLYIWVSPARSEAVVVSMTRAYERAIEKTQNWLHRSNNDEMIDEAEIAQEMNPLHSVPQRRPNRIRVTPAPDPYATPVMVPPPTITVSVPTPNITSEPQTKTASAAPVPVAVARIPESMRAPFDGASVRDTALRVTPSLLNGMEPVTLSEDIAQQLLLEKVQPSYPEQAIKAGLKGPVVLQAWIGRDGRIQDLKLVRGYLILGQAATQAVRQWKFKPYFLNGRAVEAQMLVTVDFKLP